MDCNNSKYESAIEITYCDGYECNDNTNSLYGECFYGMPLIYAPCPAGYIENGDMWNPSMYGCSQGGEFAKIMKCVKSDPIEDPWWSPTEEETILDCCNGTEQVGTFCGEYRVLDDNGDYDEECSEKLLCDDKLREYCHQFIDGIDGNFLPLNTHCKTFCQEGNGLLSVEGKTSPCNTGYYKYCDNGNLDSEECQHWCQRHSGTDMCDEIYCRGLDESVRLEDSRCQDFCEREKTYSNIGGCEVYNYFCDISNQSFDNCGGWIRNLGENKTPDQIKNYCSTHQNEETLCPCYLPDATYEKIKNKAIEDNRITDEQIINTGSCLHPLCDLDECENNCITSVNLDFEGEIITMEVNSTTEPCCLECGNKCNVKGCGGDCTCGTDSTLSVCGTDNNCKCPETCPSGHICNEESTKCVPCTPNCEGVCGGGDDTCGGTCSADCPDGKECDTENNTCEEIDFFETGGGIVVIILLVMVALGIIIFGGLKLFSGRLPVL